MGNILVATAILWGLNAIAVIPLTKMMLRRKLSQPAYAKLAMMAPDAAQAEAGKLATRTFIMVDVMVMFVAGALAGLAGFPLIGISRSLKSWPGMITLIVVSFAVAGWAHTLR